MNDVGPRATTELLQRLRLGEQDPSWTDQAACRGKPAAWWFPEKGHNADSAAGVGVCSCCPVREECLTFAVETVQVHGTWGGLTQMELRAERARRRGRKNVGGWS